MKPFIYLFSIFIVISCQKPKPVEPKEPEMETAQNDFELKGKWQLDYMSPVNNKDVNQLFKIQMPYLNFVDETKVSGNNGCNNIAGTYMMEGNTIRFETDKFITTKMFCEGVDEQAFTSVLKTINRYDILKDGKTLVLLTSDIISMQFKKVGE